MEFESNYLVLIIIVFLLSMIMRLLNYNPKAKKQPPGPRKLPIIGNLHQLTAEGSLPHRSLRELAKKYGPIMHLKLGEIPSVIISSPELAMEVIKTNDVCFQKRPTPLVCESLTFSSPDIAFAPVGDMWRQLRKICTLELLSVKRVQSFSHIREEESAKVIESIRESSSSGSAVNLKTMIFSLISSSIYRSAFGKMAKDKNEIEEFVSLMRKAIEMSSGFYLADLFPSVKPLYYVTGMKSKIGKLRNKLEKILEKIITEHQHKQDAKDEEDLIDVLLRYHPDSTANHHFHITTGTIKAVILEIFGAGIDTSASTLEWAMSELIRNPKVMAKAQAEIREAFRGKERIHESDVDKLSYLKLVIKETLRLHAPLPLNPRECTERCTIGGYEIDVGTRVMMNAWAIARDPEYWHDAERFIPERFDGNYCSIDFRGNSFEYLPFGGGRRICPGMSFSLASITSTLALLLYHFNWELPDAMKPEDLDMSEHFGLAIERKNDLFLIPTLVM